jgi:hypothetical protein
MEPQQRPHPIALSCRLTSNSSSKKHTGLCAVAGTSSELAGQTNTDFAYAYGFMPMAGDHISLSPSYLEIKAWRKQR